MSVLKKFLAASACGAVMLCATSASASVVTVGNLSSDAATGLTTDTVSGRSYTRFDAFNFTYAETLAAVAPGGAWAGWSIATAAVSDDFIAAALGGASTPCTAPHGFYTACGAISGWTDNMLGASYGIYYDFYAYLGTQTGAGFMGIYRTGWAIDYPNHYVVTDVDSYKGNLTINYLLYKDKAAGGAVPEPVSLALFGLGLAALGGTLRRRRS